MEYARYFLTDECPHVVFSVRIADEDLDKVEGVTAAEPFPCPFAGDEDVEHTHTWQEVTRAEYDAALDDEDDEDDDTPYHSTDFDGIG